MGNQFCNGCQTNWKQLWRTEEGEESYEYCPLCSSTIDLIHNDFEISPSFIKCRITGRVYDPATGVEKVFQTQHFVSFRRAKRLPKAQVLRGSPEKEQEEDEEIAAYIARYRNNKYD